MKISDLLYEDANIDALANSGNLRRGSRGPAVRALQTILRDRRFNPGTIDGIFGPNTENAVKQLQTAMRIQVDGIVGPQTKRSLGVTSGDTTRTSSSNSTGDAEVTPTNAEAPAGPGRNQSSGWSTIEINGTTYEVGNDYVRNGGEYATFSGNSARAYCQRMNWIMPTAAMCAAIARQARIIPMPTQPQYDRNSRFYPTGDAAYHTQQIFQLTGGGFPSGLVAGHKKDVVDGNGSGTCLWGGAKPGGGFWQGGGCPHGGGHRDYSQGLRPIRLPQGQRTA